MSPPLPSATPSPEPGQWAPSHQSRHSTLLTTHERRLSENSGRIARPLAGFDRPCCLTLASEDLKRREIEPYQVLLEDRQYVLARGVQEIRVCDLRSTRSNLWSDVTRHSMRWEHTLSQDQPKIGKIIQDQITGKSRLIQWQLAYRTTRLTIRLDAGTSSAAAHLLLGVRCVALLC